MRLRQMNEAMLGRLFAKKDAAAPRGASSRRIYAIGDIHGCLNELRAIIDMIDAETATSSDNTDEPTLVFLGDYIDRGPDSRAVLNTLVNLRASRTGATFLMGNHEAALLDFLAEPTRHGEWLHWGGAETLRSYGVERIWSREENDLAAELAERMPHAHRDFLESLELYCTLDDYLFVHAGVRPGVALEDQSARDLLWIRGEFHDSPAEHRPEKTVVHGHHPVKKPQDLGWRINVDTGACWSGRLSAVMLEGRRRRFIST